MYEDDELSEWIAFRLTPETRHKLHQWARVERCPLADLVYAIVCRAISAEEHQRGQPFRAAPMERIHP